MFVIVAHDLLLAGVSLWFALSLRFSFDIPPQYLDVLLLGIPLFVVIAGITFHSFRMYRALWRYASVPDLIAIIKAVTAAIVVFCLVSFAINRLEAIPRSVPIIQWLLLVVMLGGSRIMIPVLRGERWMAPLRRKTRRIPVLVVGATNDASLFIRATHETVASPFKVLGILDDSGDQTGRSLHRVPMLGPIDDLAKVVARFAARGRRPQQLIMATPPGRLNPEAVGRLMDQAERLGLTVARVPSVVELQAVQGGAVELRPLKLEDLLGRAQVQLDRKTITGLIRGRRVLITGAGGTIGSELASQIAALSPSEVILVDHSEYQLYSIELEIRERHPGFRCSPVLCDIRDERRIDQVFAQHRPQLVFNAAALKHVPLVEANPCDGVLTNVIGTRNLADAALRHQALAMIQISTDKAIYPASAMGASKRLAEDYCQALDVASAGRNGEAQRSRFITVRFGNVLGSSGSVVPLFQRQLSRGGPLTVTHPEVRRFFMTVCEAVELVLHASAHGVEQQEHGGQIFVLDMGQPIKIVDIAHQMIRLAGLRPDIDVKIEFTGLRPGERLDEELFHDEETQLPTAIPGVFTAVSCAANLNVLGRELDQLAALARRHDQKELCALLSRMVPSYTAGALAPRLSFSEHVRTHPTSGRIACSAPRPGA